MLRLRPNTMDAHRLMRWAAGQKKADAMAEALFEAFFGLIHTKLSLLGAG